MYQCISFLVKRKWCCVTIQCCVGSAKTLHLRSYQDKTKQNKKTEQIRNHIKTKNNNKISNTSNQKHQIKNTTSNKKKQQHQTKNNNTKSKTQEQIRKHIKPKTQQQTKNIMKLKSIRTKPKTKKQSKITNQKSNINKAIRLPYGYDTSSYCI